jgi:hypothetical protein
VEHPIEESIGLSDFVNSFRTGILSSLPWNKSLVQEIALNFPVLITARVTSLESVFMLRLSGKTTEFFEIRDDNEAIDRWKAFCEL